MRQLVFVRMMKGRKAAPAVREAEPALPKPLEIGFLNEGRGERLYTGGETVIFRTSGTGLSYETSERYNAYGVRFEIVRHLPL